MEKEWKKAKESRVVPHPKLNPGCATATAHVLEPLKTSDLFIFTIVLEPIQSLCKAPS